MHKHPTHTRPTPIDHQISPTGFSPLKSPRKVTVTPLKRCPAPLSLVFTPSSSVKVVSISSASTSATAITSNKKSVKRNLYGELTDDVKGNYCVIIAIMPSSLLRHHYYCIIVAIASSS